MSLTISSVPHRLAIALFLACGPPQLAAAQDQPAVPAAPPAHLQQISANPFGLLLGFFNAEFERKVSESATLGVGGSLYGGSPARLSTTEGAVAVGIAAPGTARRSRCTRTGDTEATFSRTTAT